MMKIRHYLFMIIIATGAGFAGSFAFNLLQNNGQQVVIEKNFTKPEENKYALAASSTAELREGFVTASHHSRPAVVNIRVTGKNPRSAYGSEWHGFWDFFGNLGPSVSTGSGVIVSKDGYIVTNHHVIKDGDQIEVFILDRKKAYKAKLVGQDPSTDLAVVKIESNNLPVIEFGNSDQVQIGEWVLAVGNPFNLSSTVTAGIVSAKGRSINILKNQFPIESFIQTDAAINPGNSGGALVNLDGKLVGINTAIMSRTGSYAGYGFAIPVNIVKKIVSDLKEFGTVQRAFIEAAVSDIDEKLAEEFGDENMHGVYVGKVYGKGNAEAAGLQQGDVIIAIEGKAVKTTSNYEEILAAHSPGDKVVMTVLRGNSQKNLNITLRNSEGGTGVVKNTSVKSEFLGADFKELSKMEMDRLGVSSGIKVFNIGQGQVRRLGLPDGFVITAFNGRTYNDPNILIKDMENASGRIRIEGIKPDGSRGMYSFFMF